MKLAFRKAYGAIGISVGMSSLAILFYVLADFKQTINPIDPGPALFPKMTAIFTLILCAGHIIPTVLKEIKKSGKEVVKEEDTKTNIKLIFLYVLGTLALTLIYIALFEHVSYIILTSLFLFSIMFLLGVRKWKLLLTVAILYALISYYLYAKILMVPLT